MITTYDSGYKDHPEELLQRFGARLAIFELAANATLISVDLAEIHDSIADPRIDTELARAIQELHSDYRQMRKAIEEFVRELRDRAYPQRNGGAE